MSSSRLVLLLGSLALACNPSAPGADTGGASEGSGSDGVGTTSGATTDPTSTASTASSDAEASSAGTSTSTTSEPTTGAVSESGTSGLADGCDAFTSEEECEAVPGCAAVDGIAQEFAGCTFGAHFLGCIDEAPCDAVVLTICRDGTDEVYEIGDGCIPPGFSPCEGPGEHCPADCEAIVTAGECTTHQCRVVFAAPHIVVDGQVCASYGSDEEFLGCLGADAVCADDTIIICPEGQMDPSWDSASGCIPPGFATCDAPSVPPCP